MLGRINFKYKSLKNAILKSTNPFLLKNKDQKIKSPALKLRGKPRKMAGGPAQNLKTKNKTERYNLTLNPSKKRSDVSAVNGDGCLQYSSG